MKKITSIRDFKKEVFTLNIQNEIENLKEEIEVLKSVKFLTKKDGSEFKNLSKNFDGLTISLEGLIPAGYIYYRDKNKASKCLSINVTIEAEKVQNIENRTIARLKYNNNIDCYYMTAEEVQKELLKEQSRRLSKIETLNKIIDSIDSLEIIKTIELLQKQFKDIEKLCDIDRNKNNYTGFNYELFYIFYQLMN